MNNLVFTSALALHAGVMSTAIYRFNASKSPRVMPLWKFAFADGVFFPIALVVLTEIVPLQNALDLLTAIFYVWLAVFVLSFEIPGYLSHSRYDDMYVKYLKEVRAILLKVSYSYESIVDLKAKVAERKNHGLDDSDPYVLLMDFIGSCERMRNIDKPLWSLILAEITTTIKDISTLSKHPVPKLIDILSLTGLSLLLAQILKIL